MFLEKSRNFTWILIILGIFLLIINRIYIQTLFSEHPEQNSMKYILYWNSFFSQKDYYFGYGSEIFKDCPISACSTTDNKTLMPVDKFDAIIFHARTYSIATDSIPKKRSPHQKYIFLSLESPTYTLIDEKTTNNFYNWTMTYRRDSDIYYPYALVQKINSNYTLPTYEKIRKKTKMVAWFVTRCDVKRRTEYVKDLKNYISVDIYGKCGNLSCPRSRTEECLKMLERDYYFYLSFENSYHTDYITEKFFNVSKYDVIPVVMGGADYEALAPPRSFINVENFESPKILANYLINLSSSYNDYIKYFEWKKTFGIFPSQKFVLCKLCEKLHSPLEYTSYANIVNWFK